MAEKAIYEVDKATNLNGTDYVYSNTGNNIRQISGKDFAGADFKNLKLYAASGKNLGTSYTQAQKSEIKNGTFNGLNIGDYWVIGGITWRIWDIDWYLRKGDIECTEHHLVIIPDSCLISPDGSTHLMNDTDTTAGGYNGTKYRNTYKEQCETKIKECFGDNILLHRELLSTATENGKASVAGWYDATVELPSEIMMYGSIISGDGGHNVGTAFPQLALVRIYPSTIVNRENYWLRDVVSASVFAIVDNSGVAGGYNASHVWGGIRPYFLLH